MNVQDHALTALILTVAESHGELVVDGKEPILFLWRKVVNRLAEIGRDRRRPKRIRTQGNAQVAYPSFAASLVDDHIVFVAHELRNEDNHTITNDGRLSVRNSPRTRKESDLSVR